MQAFFLTALMAALATASGREAVRVARLAQALGSRASLLVALWLAAAGSSAFAGWFGAELAAQLLPGAKASLMALTLLLASGEVLLLRAHAAPREPTRSLPAVAFVLLGAQLTDGARLLVLALAASSGSPLLAALGGLVGSGVVLTFAWALGSEWETRLPVTGMRWAGAGVLLVAALLTGVTALLGVS